MIDWADEIVDLMSDKKSDRDCRLRAGSVFWEHGVACLSRGEIAAALRKARADGMREAADFLSFTPYEEFGNKPQFVFQVRRIRGWADCVHQGPTDGKIKY